MVAVAVGAKLLGTAAGIRLDVEYGIYASSLVGKKDLVPLVNVFEAGWVPKTDPPEGECLYCEIGDIDRIGRITPVAVDPNYGDVHPEQEQQIDRRLKKINKGTVGVVDGWSVLVPKTRPYLKKFGLVTGQEDFLYTTDLMMFKPGPVLLGYCKDDYSAACCLLWLMLKQGDLGDLVASLARWGKTYPTLNLDDFTDITLSKASLQKWVKRTNAMPKAFEIRDCVEKIFNLQSRISEVLK